MADFTIKARDTTPAITATLSDQAGGINLSTATQVKFIAKGATVTISGICTVVNGPSGIVKYQWVANDTNVAGDYSLEWEITWPGPLIETVPNDGYKTMTILADLA